MACATPTSRWVHPAATFAATLVLAVALVTPLAFAQDAAAAGLTSANRQKQFLTGWEFDRAPTTTQISLYTDLNLDSTNAGDFWSYRIRLNAEVAMPFYTQASVFAQWGYLIEDQGANTAGVEDLQLGGKLAFIDEPFAILTAAVSVTIPIEQDAALPDEAVLSAIWLMGTALFNSSEFSAGINGTIRFGKFFATSPGEPGFFNFHAMAEAFISVLSTVSMRAGVDMDYVGGTFDKTSAMFYVEVQLLFESIAPFLRAGFPIDVDNPFTSIENGVSAGDFALIAGLSYIF